MDRDWSSDVCSSDLPFPEAGIADLKTADDRADIYLRETTTSA
jgi:hypothetical protein